MLCFSLSCCCIHLVNLLLLCCWSFFTILWDAAAFPRHASPCKFWLSHLCNHLPQNSQGSTWRVGSDSSPQSFSPQEVLLESYDFCQSSKRHDVTLIYEVCITLVSGVNIYYITYHILLPQNRDIQGVLIMLVHLLPTTGANVSEIQATPFSQGAWSHFETDPFKILANWCGKPLEFLKNTRPFGLQVKVKRKPSIPKEKIWKATLFFAGISLIMSPRNLQFWTSRE